MQRVELTEWESCKKVDGDGSRGEEGGSHRRGREEGEPRGSNGQRRLSCRCNPPVSVSEMNWRWSESGFTETTVQHVSQRRRKKTIKHLDILFQDYLNPSVAVVRRHNPG